MSTLLLYTQTMEAKNLKWWDLSSAIILLFILFIAATRLQVTNWTDTLYITVNLVLIGGILGILLGASQFKPRTVTLFSVVYTVFFVVWQTSLTIETYVNVQERLQNVWLRIVFSLYQLTRGNPVDDAILFLLLAGLFCWILALTAGYLLVRKGQPMIPTLIMAVGVIVIEFFEPGNKHPIMVSIFFVLALLLLARTNYLHSQADWRKQGIQVDMELGFDISRGALAAGVILVLLAWNTPDIIKALKPGSLERARFEHSLNDFEQTFNDFVAPLKNKEPRPFVFDDRLDLGLGSDLGDTLLYTIQSSIPDNSGARYYWRVRSYDIYRNGAWRNANLSRQRIPSFDKLLEYPEFIGRTKVNFTIQLRSLVEDQLIIPTMPLAISVNVTAEYLKNGLEEADIIRVSPNEEFGSGKIYLVQSLFATPILSQLKNAGTDYPEWVQDYYLDLPEGFSERVRQLALEITAAYDNPYDKAIAITNYLRNNIEYQAKIPPIPVGQDPIEWFLFDLKKGFCNYYATAEILMLRAVGVPSRLAVGYAQGTQEGEKTYAVRERDSHAWPEVYFPGIGWVEFEPTVSQAETRFNITPPAVLENNNQNPIDNPLLNIPLLSDKDPFNRAEEEEARLDRLLQEEANRQKLIGWMLVAGVLVLAGAFILWVRSRSKMRQRMVILLQRVDKNLEKRGIRLPNWLKNTIWNRKISPMNRMFSVVTWALHHLHLKYYPGMTASQQVDTLKNHLPKAKAALEILLVEYEKAMYTDQPADMLMARKASRQVRWLVIKAWANRLIHGTAQEEYEKILHRGNL